MKIPSWQRIGFVLIIFYLIYQCASCSMSDEIQGEVITVRLVKIDTIYRFNGDEVVLTWDSFKRSERIITREKLDHKYKVGIYTTYIKRN